LIEHSIKGIVVADGQRRTQDGGKRGTPGRRAPDAEGTRERIMDAAQRLFAERGFDATSTASVAAAAEVPGGLVFYYFPTKRDLLMAVVRERTYRGSLPEVIAKEAAEGPEELLRRVVQELTAVFHRNRETQVILFREAHTDPELQERIAELMASSTGDLAGLLADLPAVRVDADGRSAAARLVVSGLLLDNFLRPEGADPARFEPMVRLLAAAVSDPGPATAAGESEASADEAESALDGPASADGVSADGTADEVPRRGTRARSTEDPAP
jgi:AcrR family transcriptional regulator